MDDLELEGQVWWELAVLLNGPVSVAYGNTFETEQETWGATVWHIFPHALPEARL